MVQVVPVARVTAAATSGHGLVGRILRTVGMNASMPSIRRWTIPTDGYGDCDDYAVTKRKELLDAGFPVSALRLAVVYSPRTARHAVLTVTTDKGDLVLDNMAETIVSWNATGYTWIERQAATDPMKWVSLRPSFVADNASLPTADVSLVKSHDTPTSAIAIAARTELSANTVLDQRTISAPTP